MNKTQHINIGGIPFTIDEDAYKELEDYLDKIDRHFRHAEGHEEIIGDIERRMAELLEERLKQKKIVSSEDVAYCISILGTPSDFEADDDPAFAGPAQDYKYKTGKRLFRDPDDKIIGGVCSGLAAYFGIQDPIWVRIGFALAALGAGVGVPIYILIWALVSEAQTPRDFLAMRGEPINVQNIARIVEEQVEHITDQLSELGNDWKEKKRKKKSSGKRRKSWKDHL